MPHISTMGKRKRGDDGKIIDGSPPSKLTFTDNDSLTSGHEQLGSPLPPNLQQVEADLRKVMDDFVQVYERLDTGDDPTKKPNYSYTELVYLAILRSPNFCLPITEIYKYIKSRFTFFRDAKRTHWKNAVRHSLSKTKCFTKIAVGRRNGLPGLPNRSSFLWCILPNSIVSFARGDYRPTVDKESGMNTLRWGYYKVNAGQFWSQVGIYLEKKFDSFQMMVSNSSDPRGIVKFQICSLPEVWNDPDAITPEILVKGESVDDIESTFSGGLSDGSDFMGKFDINEMLNFGETVNYRDNDAKLTPPPLSCDDSGHETLESSPDDDFNGDMPSYKKQSQNLNSSYLSFLPSHQNTGRLTPELPDLGHVSPFELSPLSNHGSSPPPSMMISAQNLSRISPVPFPPSHLNSYTSYYSPYQSSHLMYPALHDMAYPYPVNTYPIQGHDPMMSVMPEWNAN